MNRIEYFSAIREALLPRRVSTLNYEFLALLCKLPPPVYLTLLRIACQQDHLFQQLRWLNRLMDMFDLEEGENTGRQQFESNRRFDNTHLRLSFFINNKWSSTSIVFVVTLPEIIDNKTDIPIGRQHPHELLIVWNILKRGYNEFMRNGKNISSDEYFQIIANTAQNIQNLQSE